MSEITTIDVTKSELMLTLSKEGLAYQQLLQDAENVVFSRETLNEERGVLVSLRKVKSKLDAMENPHTKVWKAWNESRKSLVDPVAAVLQKKEGEFRKLATEIAAENAKIEADKQRKVAINQAIDTFFLEQSQAIVAAKEPSELVRIEKLIGSHKANSSRYQEFLPLMAQKASNLTELIKVQKESIKILEGLKRKEIAAEAAGQDQAVLDLREHQEQIQATLEQSKIDVQESAISMATQADVIEPEVIIPIVPKARFSRWSWEMIDEKAATKAGLTMVVPHEIAIKEILAKKREDGKEGVENGIRYFIEKKY